MNPLAREYLENRVRSASPLELIVILYEGAIQHIGEAKLAMETKMLEKKTAAVNMASRFIAELQVSLNMEKGGEVAVSLSRLYGYFQKRLIEANVKNSPPILDELLRLIRGLHDTWGQLARQQHGAPTPSQGSVYPSPLSPSAKGDAGQQPRRLNVDV